MKDLSVLSSLALAALAITATAAPSALPAPAPPSIGPFSNCAPYRTDFVVSSASFTSPVPCPGQNMCLAVSGQLTGDIVQGAILSIVGKWFGRIVYTGNLDVGALLAAAGTPLPFPASTPGTNTTLTLCPPLKNTFPAGVRNIR